MLNRIEVTEPPNSAPQYMLDSRMMAETGCMPKVSGNKSATPFGAPRPGSTPTRIPSSPPIIISPTCCIVMAMPKPCIRESMLPMTRSESHHLKQRAVRQRDDEQLFEHEIEKQRHGDRHRARLPPWQLAMPADRRQHIAGRSDV